MKKTAKFRHRTLIIWVITTALASTGLADNPIVQTIYTADPAPFVHDGVCYVYTSHDEDVLVDNFFTMKDWRCFSSTDMVNWTDHGVVASLRDFKWASSGWGGGFENGAWAPHAIERDGKWYLYCPLHGRGIGVLVADNPFGPFTDPIGKPLIGGQYDSIDPAVFIDDPSTSSGQAPSTGSGQAYLYWGNPKCWYVKLNKDMISYDTGIGDNGLVVLDMTVEAFGKRSEQHEERPTSYEEGPWLYKRNGLYYLFFAAGPIPEHLGYSTGPSPEGPWTYGGVLMDTQSAFTIHPGVVDYKGKTYLFYHNAALPGGGGFHRSVCVDEMTFNADGSVDKVMPTKEGAGQIGHLDPFVRVEAETICWTGGVETQPCDEGGMNVCDVNNGDYIKVKGVDFGEGAASFEARVASATNGGNIEIRLGSESGPLVGTCAVPGTGDWQTWVTTSCKVNDVAGIHDLYLVFTGGNGSLFNVNWWKFKSEQRPVSNALPNQAEPARNPIIWADVPDPAVIRVGDTYYMSSTTMHMSPGLPIMKSKNLVDWNMLTYAYDRLVENDAMNLENGRNAYGRGSWASCLRYHDGTYYATTFSATSGRTHIYTTEDIEKGDWTASSFAPVLHDNTLFFDDDGRVYMIYGGGKLTLVELEPDLSGIKPDGVNKVIIENTNLLFGEDEVGGLNGEGSQLLKVNGTYYLMNIASPRSRWSRSVLIHRADKITGPYEGRVGLEDKGVAQGCLIDTPDGKWYAMLFQDTASVGRCPWLIPVTWEDGWPVFGINGKAPTTTDIEDTQKLVNSNIVASDEFNRKPGEPLPLAWQWNHNPDHSRWSIGEREGHLRITTGRIDSSVLSAKNILTQRTFGPVSSATTKVDVGNMKDGDYAGMIALQARFGAVCVKMENGSKSIVMMSAGAQQRGQRSRRNQAGPPVEVESVPLTQSFAYFKIDCDFRDRTDKAYFYYSLDGKTWTRIGSILQMSYTMPHFMGYRFGLFNYATETVGGYADFDYYHVTDEISAVD